VSAFGIVPIVVVVGLIALIVVLSVRAREDRDA